MRLGYPPRGSDRALLLYHPKHPFVKTEYFTIFLLRICQKRRKMQKIRKTKKTFRKGLTNREGCDIILAVRSVGFENKQTPSRHTTRVRMVHSLLPSSVGWGNAVCAVSARTFFIFHGGTKPLAPTIRRICPSMRRSRRQRFA